MKEYGGLVKFSSLSLVVLLSLSLLACSTWRKPQSLNTDQKINAMDPRIPKPERASTWENGLIPKHDIDIVAPKFKPADLDVINASVFSKDNYENARPVLSTLHCNIFAYGIKGKATLKKDEMIIADTYIKSKDGNMLDKNGIHQNYSYIEMDLITLKLQKLRLFCEARDPNKIPNVMAMAIEELKGTFEFPTRDQANDQYNILYPPEHDEEADSFQ